MIKTSTGSLTVLQFDLFRNGNKINHGITTKEGWKTGNKPRFTSAENPDCAEYGKELSHAIGITPGQIYFPKQIHSDSVEVIGINSDPGAFKQCDGLITNRRNICLAIQTADCVPVLMFDPVKEVIASVHAGWRGTVSKIVQKTVLQMTGTFGCKPEDILAGIGPSINKHAYEVGEDVINRVMESFENYHSLLIPSMKDGKAFFDLWEANRSLLLEAGIQSQHIETLKMCTYELDNLFFSARRDGIDTGRNVSYIMMN